MAKSTKRPKAASGRPARAKVTREEALKRMEEFPKRKENFVATVRKGKNRSVPA